MAGNGETSSYEPQLPQGDTIDTKGIVADYLKNHPVSQETLAELDQVQQKHKEGCEQCMADSKLARQALIADIGRTQGYHLEGEKFDLASLARVAVVNCNAQTSLKDVGLEVPGGGRISFFPPNQLRVGADSYTISAPKDVEFRDIVIKGSEIALLINKRGHDLPHIEVIPKAIFCQTLDQALRNPPGEMFAGRLLFEKNNS